MSHNHSSNGRQATALVAICGVCPQCVEHTKRIDSIKNAIGHMVAFRTAIQRVDLPTAERLAAADRVLEEVRELRWREAVQKNPVLP